MVINKISIMETVLRTWSIKEHTKFKQISGKKSLPS